MFKRAVTLATNGLFRSPRVMSDFTKLNQKVIVKEISHAEKPTGILSQEPTSVPIQNPAHQHPILRPITEKEYQQLLHHLEEAPRTSYS